MSNRSPVSPAVPPTHPNPVFTPKKYIHRGRPSGVRDRRAIVRQVHIVKKDVIRLMSALFLRYYRWS